MTDASQSDQLLTIKEVARILRVDDTTVRRWVKTKRLKAIILPSGQNKAYRIQRQTLDLILQEV